MLPDRFRPLSQTRENSVQSGKACAVRCSVCKHRIGKCNHFLGRNQRGAEVDHGDRETSTLSKTEPQWIKVWSYELEDRAENASKDVAIMLAKKRASALKLAGTLRHDDNQSTPEKHPHDKIWHQDVHGEQKVTELSQNWYIHPTKD